jgi:hypothetical protein
LRKEWHALGVGLPPISPFVHEILKNNRRYGGLFRIWQRIFCVGVVLWVVVMCSAAMTPSTLVSHP